MKYILWFFSLLPFTSTCQDSHLYLKILENGALQSEQELVVLRKAGHLAAIEKYDAIIARYWNKDSTKLVLIARKVSDFDPTNDIRNDEHNKVNFITFDAFQEKGASTHTLSMVSAIYARGTESSARWYAEITATENYYTDINHNILIHFLRKHLSSVFLDPGTNRLVEDFWQQGRFASSPDLRSHPDWENYGQHAWKNKEQKWRPYNGLPVIVREYYLKQHKNQ